MFEYGTSGQYELQHSGEEEGDSRNARCPTRTGTGIVRAEGGELPKLKVWAGRAVAEALVDTRTEVSQGCRAGH